jgi:ABC-2 type transport system ATP-binding protein
VALAGRNGAGKTTLLRLAAGLLNPSGGSVCVGGEASLKRIREIGYVGDGWELPAWMRVGMMADLQRGAVAGFDGRVFAELCRLRGIEPSDTYPKLSKGKRKWVLIALALARPAKLLLLDEPGDGLDPAARRELYGLVRKQALERGSAVVVSTHNLADAERMADTIAILDRGRLALSGELDVLRDEVRLAELDGEEGVEIEGTMQCLHQDAGDGRRVLWLRGDRQELERWASQVGRAAILRPVDLESLFVAVYGGTKLGEEVQ